MNNQPSFQIGFKEREQLKISSRGIYEHASHTFDHATWIRVDIQALAGNFEGAASDYLSIDHLERFLTHVEALYQTLKGEAFLGTIDTRFSIAIKGDGLGHSSATFELGDDHATLTGTIELDQTFLPKLVGELKGMVTFYTHSSR